MRMGKPNKKSRSRRKSAAKQNRPKHSSPGLVVGQVSSNLIASIYTPTITDIANRQLEQYAVDLLDYQDFLAAQSQKDEAEVDIDGTLMDNTELLSPPSPPLFSKQASLDDFSLTLSEISKHFSDKTKGWKVHANAAKFERQLDEKYGVFRPFITNHPEIENAIRSIQRKYAMGSFSPFRQGDPPLGTTTSIILLFMLQRNGVRWEAMVLAVLFLLVGLQPWALVALVALVYSQLEKRKQATVGSMKSTIEPVRAYYKNKGDESKETDKAAFLRTPVGTPLAKDEALDATKYDTIVLGSGPPTLYGAALLSRAGRKVLVLSSRKDASGCLELSKDAGNKFSSIPFDVDPSNVSRLQRMQKLLAPALCTTTDLQGGIRFAEIGSQADGYAFEILSIPGMGGGDGGDPFVLRAAGGVGGLMEDTATFLGDGWPGSDDEIGNSIAGTYLAVCATINGSASEYYLSKILPESTSALRKGNTYQDMSLRYASGLLDKYFALNAHVRSLMAGIGMRSESLKPSKTSVAAHVSNICSTLSSDGMHYPVGGPRALSHALAAVVEQCGGRVATGVAVSELVFESDEGDDGQATKNEGDTKDDKSKEEEVKAPRCIGVKLADGRVISLQCDSSGTDVSPAILSMEGLIHTFIHLLPEAVRSKHKVPRGLPALTESRPVFKMLFALKGSAEDLNLTGADFYRLPEAALARDEKDPITGAVKLGVIGGSDDDEEEEYKDDGTRRDKTTKVAEELTTADDTTTTDQAGLALQKKKKAKKVKFDTGSSWIHVSFPSAKDPAFSSVHGKDVTTCVVTIEADDDFVTFYETKPKLYTIPPQKEKSSESGDRIRLLERVKKDLIDTFPQLEGKIEHSEVRGPFHRGLSHNPERYAAKGVRADSPYPGLFVGGSDLTVGGSFAGSIVGGWLATNAVIGYSVVDHMYLEKNITSDLERFLSPPDSVEEEDLAVPYVPKAAATTDLSNVNKED